MLAFLATVLLALPVRAAAPALRIEAPGYLRDARAELDGQRLVLRARILEPVVISRRTFAVEARDAEGRVLFRETMEARVRPSGARHRHPVRASFELELPALDGATEVRIAPAR